MRQAILLLRYRTIEPKSKTTKYVSYARISKAVSQPYNIVQHLCRQALKKKRRKANKNDRKLEQQQIDFLLSKDTLNLWAGKILAERCMLFHRKFPHKRIAVTSLRRLYLTNGVKRKIVRQEKLRPSHIRDNLEESKCKKLAEINAAVAEGRKILWLDELNFTKRTLQSREWSAKNSNLAIDQEQVYQGYKSVIVTVSRESGLEHYDIYDSAITQEEFADHLQILRKKNGKVPLALFMD